MNYSKFIVIFLAIYAVSWLWQSYDYLIIPEGNMQMSPSFKEKEPQVATKILDPQKIGYNDVLYYSFPRASVNKKLSMFFGRVIGLPGDRIRFEKGSVYRNDVLLEEPYQAMENKSKENFAEILVPRDYLYLLVDSRKKANDLHYRDSRHWGPFVMASVRGHLTQK